MRGTGWHALRDLGSIWENPCQDLLPAGPLSPNARGQRSAPWSRLRSFRQPSFQLCFWPRGPGTPEAKNGERLEVQKSRGTPAPRPSAAQLQWRQSQQSGCGNQHVGAGSYLRPRRPAAIPVAPCFTHPTCASGLPFQHTLCLGHPTSCASCACAPQFLCTCARKRPHSGYPAPRTPHVLIPRILRSLYALHRAPWAP